jgi:hypothetical protein
MKRSWRDRYASAHLKVFMFAARCLGVLALLSGVYGVFSFVILRTRLSDLIYGLMCLVLGAGLFNAKLPERGENPR